MGIAAAYEHIGKDFQMDSGFVRRTGIDEGWLWIGPSFYPNLDKMAWLKRIDPHFTFSYLHDHFTDMDDSYFRAAVDFSFTKQGRLGANFIRRKESWKRGTEEIYNINIIYSRTTYQFNKYLFARAIVQYDSYKKNLLTDILASFTFIPGTVIHLGYGGLYEKQDWQSEHWVPGLGNLQNMRRSFFFKASYLWRF